MAEPIHDIIECSHKIGKVPKEWKRADIMPIYKNGYKELLNYRPVSLISIRYVRSSRSNGLYTSNEKK